VPTSVFLPPEPLPLSPPPPPPPPPLHQPTRLLVLPSFCAADLTTSFAFLSSIHPLPRPATAALLPVTSPASEHLPKTTLNTLTNIAFIVHCFSSPAAASNRTIILLVTFHLIGMVAL
jgi:hypothetical protein